MITQQLGAEGVHGRDVHCLDVNLLQPRLNSVLQLIGRFIREGGHQYPLRLDQPRAHQVHHPPSQHLCLAGTGAGDDKKRRAVVCDRLKLFSS